MASSTCISSRRWLLAANVVSLLVGVFLGRMGFSCQPSTLQFAAHEDDVAMRELRTLMALGSGLPECSNVCQKRCHTAENRAAVILLSLGLPPGVHC